MILFNPTHKERNMNSKVTAKTTEPAPVNLKAQNAEHSFRIDLRDKEHFYRVVNWLNGNVGKGSDKWTMEGRPLKSIKQGKSVNTQVYIFVADFDESSVLYLSLV